MRIVSVFYAALGYLALLAAILWGMLFVGHGVMIPNMDAPGTAAPLKAAFADIGLLLLLLLLQRSMSRGMLQASSQAWATAVVLVLIYLGWQPLPQVLWHVTGPALWTVSALFYPAWTLIMIGAFLNTHLEEFQSDGALGMLGKPLYCGILMAVWATSVMTVGHLLLAVAVTAYLLLGTVWALRKSGARSPRGAFSFQRERVAR
jgi:methanethiol S-methyltransferase